MTKLLAMIQADPSVWLMFFGLGVALLAAPVLVSKNREHQGVSLVLLGVWSSLTVIGFTVPAVSQWAALLIDIAAGAYISSKWRNGVAGVVTLMFIPMVMLRGADMIIHMLDPRTLFFTYALLAWAQLLAFTLGARFDRVELFYDRWCRSARLYDTVAARLGRTP